MSRAPALLPSCISGATVKPPGCLPEATKKWTVEALRPVLVWLASGAPGQGPAPGATAPDPPPWTSCSQPPAHAHQEATPNLDATFTGKGAPFRMQGSFCAGAWPPWLERCKESTTATWHFPITHGAPDLEAAQHGHTGVRGDGVAPGLGLGGLHLRHQCLNECAPRMQALHQGPREAADVPGKHK